MGLYIDSDRVSIPRDCMSCTFECGYSCDVRPVGIDNEMVPDEGKPDWCPLREQPNQVLKKCPFCGGDAVTKVDYTSCGGDQLVLSAYIICKDCGVSKRVKFNALDKPFEDFYTAFDQVKTLWNHREDV